jgi:hypothetical protein
MVPIDNACQLCHEQLLFREGKEQLISPRCCGKSYHANCFQHLLNSSSNSSSNASRCPNCRRMFTWAETDTATDEVKDNGPVTWNEIMI